jgi:hypothetical protein
MLACICYLDPLETNCVVLEIPKVGPRGLHIFNAPLELLYLLEREIRIDPFVFLHAFNPGPANAVVQPSFFSIFYTLVVDIHFKVLACLVGICDQVNAVLIMGQNS